MQILKILFWWQWCFTEFWDIMIFDSVCEISSFNRFNQILLINNNFIQIQNFRIYRLNFILFYFQLIKRQIFKNLNFLLNRRNFRLIFFLSLRNFGLFFSLILMLSFNMCSLYLLNSKLLHLIMLSYGFDILI